MGLVAGGGDAPRQEVPLYRHGHRKGHGHGGHFHRDQGSGGSNLLPHVVVEGGVGHQHVCPLLGHVH